MAVSNLKFKTLQISFVVIDRDRLEKIKNLMSALFNELQANCQRNELVEILFEIRSNDEMYSGKDGASFLQVFEDDNQAEFLRIIVQKSELNTKTTI